MQSKVELIQNYLYKIEHSNKELTKKEAFKDLLNRLYAGNPEIAELIDQISLGAETTVLNIPRKDKLHKGSADTLFNNIIIEFENNLKHSFKHAKQQLAGYMLGQFNSGEGYNYTLIATDFINWKVLAPDISCLENLENLTEDELILNEIESASIVLKEDNIEEFYYWIDRFLFKEDKQKATLKRIEESFGYQSQVFIECFREMNLWFDKAKKFGEIQVSFDQWHKFLSIAYGSYEATDSNFLIHTYLSIFSKMLAYSVISNDDFIDDNEMEKILDGSIFYTFNITNFIVNDFFHWVKSDRNFRNLKKVFRMIAQEISVYEFQNVDEDILKGVYQELIDLDTRHALGEYYTPDWLCERIVGEFDFKLSDKILDPSCGSGSFLRAVVHKVKKLYPSISASELGGMIFGIDIHPLSVQIAKTTMLLALGRDILDSKKPVHLNIILANTLLAPEGIKDLFGTDFIMYIDRDSYSISTQVLDNIELFDNLIDISDDLSEQTKFQHTVEKDIFYGIIKNKRESNGINNQILESFYTIYKALKKVKENKRDTIWKFILSNLYKPYFLHEKFNYVIGNPPWLTFSSIKNEEYQDILNKLAVQYNIKPQKIANFPHLEIAAIFMAHCSSYFLKDEGKLAFVLPRSFFSADHHENTRNGKAKGFTITGIWDFESVKPLFRIPSSVMFCVKSNSGETKNKIFDGMQFKGNLPYHNCNWETAQTKLSEEPVKWHYSKQGNSSAFTLQKRSVSLKTNPYKKLFKQGATIVPRAFYFVDLAQQTPPDFEDRIVYIKTSKSAKSESKAQWKGISLDGRMESKYLFNTLLSKSILPFAYINPEMVVLPVKISYNEINEKVITVHPSREIMYSGDLNASRWFSNTERIWEIKRTQKSKVLSSSGRVDFHKGLSSQNLNAPYLVLYNSSAKDANAVVISRKDFNLELIVESKTYVYYTSSIEEANYICSILNSETPNELMKDFQTRGLFGPRDIHKKILDIYFPKYNSGSKTHRHLAELGTIAHNKAKIFLENKEIEKNLTPILLGKLRLEIKQHLSTEMDEIDILVKKIL